MHVSFTPAPGRPVRLLQVTDTHLFADPAAEAYGIRTAESLARVLGQALASGPRPDALLVTGDIGDDCSEAAYRRFRATLAQPGLPVYCLPGNHDDPHAMARLLQDAPFQVGGQALLGSWLLMLLDSHVPGVPQGRLGDAALARFEAGVVAHAARNVLVAVHHPPMPIGSAWIDAMGLEDGATLLAMLERHPQVRAVTSGHVHQAFECRHGPLRLFTSPSTCIQFAPHSAEFAIDLRPPGWRRLELWPDGRIDTTVHWLDAQVVVPATTPVA